MDVNQCHIVQTIENDLKQFPDGFSLMMKKYVVTGERVPNKDTGVMEELLIWSPEVGPFHTIRDAVKYAHAWTDLEKPPAMPEFVPEADPPKDDDNSENQGGAAETGGNGGQGNQMESEGGPPRS